ncbi:scm-like with four MBT domains protein 2 isoform X2 [Dermacentor albipictus]|uniref:scm-like with four MBT domains protein 2 isoform X2 n=1 Tax=Dermacentor albipictus TaxID=60249 RepID=UPI0038FC504A
MFHIQRQCAEAFERGGAAASAAMSGKVPSSPKKEGSPHKRQSLTGTTEDDGEAEFHWDDYLESTQSEAVPATAFAHVEHSLESGLRPGMKLEVPLSSADGGSGNGENGGGVYWLASVVTTCGPLLSLRYLGYGADRSADFWCDVGTNEVHPLGWCARNHKPLKPPPAILEKHLDWEKLLADELKSAVTVPAYVLEMKGSAPIDQIQPGMKLLVLEEENPLNGWAASVLKNVGGRLLLRYDGCSDPHWDLWLFYLSHRVKALDTPSHGDQNYRPPQCIENLHSLDEWKRILRESMGEAQKYNGKILANILQPPVPLSEHSFEVGHKVELLNPLSRTEACPATVTASLASGQWFLVQVDDLRHPAEAPPLVRCCHARSQTLLPVGWAQKNGLSLLAPPGYMHETFNWEEYLRSCAAKAAPRSCFHLEEDSLGFEPNQKLEVVNGKNPNELCVGTVERVCPPLVWVRLEDSVEGGTRVVLPLRSQQLFPVGWCGSNGWPLRPPRDWAPPGRPSAPSPLRRAGGSTAAPSTSAAAADKTSKKSGSVEAKSGWCPALHLNHRCFSGPLLSKGRLAELPRQTGPGPVALVLREVLAQLIGVAYKPSRVLAILQLRGSPTPGMHQQTLKAKYKGKTYRATVETVRSSGEVGAFCRSICEKLECCPNLFGPTSFGENSCPDNCSGLTKTKYTYHFVRKRHKRQMALRKAKQARSESPASGANASSSGSTGELGEGKQSRVDVTISASQQGAASKELNATSTSNTNTTTSAAAAAAAKKSERLSNRPATRPPTRIGHRPPGRPPGRPPKSANRQPPPPPVSSSCGSSNAPPPDDRPGVRTRGARLPDFKTLNLDLRWQKPLRARLLSNKKQQQQASRSDTPDSLSSEGTAESAQEASSRSLSSLVSTQQQQQQPKPHIPHLCLESNPIEWTVGDVARFVAGTNCAPLVRVLQEQEIDGQALLLLTLPMVQEFLELQPDPAIQFCQLLERIKLAFYLQYAK